MRRSSTVVLVVVVTALAACASAPPATVAPPGSPGVSSSPSEQPPPSTPASEAPSAAPSSPPLAWTQLDAAQGPAAREDHTWTLDPDAGIAYLFGGRDGATVHGDTWAFDLATDTWTRLEPPTSPPARFGHEAAWVDGHGVVIFAGQAGTTFYGDLWAFDPEAGTWSQLPASGDPPVPRYGSCAAVGPDGRLWISHGFTEDGNRFADTRAYDFASGAWTDETPSGEVPVLRCLHGCWWTDDGDLALYAGQTTDITSLDDRWLLADGAWSVVDGQLPPARNLYARTRIDGGTLVLGGQALDGSYLGDLWLLADGSADAGPVEPVGDGPPAGRAGAELIGDADRDRVLLFGGRTADGALNDLWSLAGVGGL
jgi:Galactose oxidase, central domain